MKIEIEYKQNEMEQFLQKYKLTLFKINQILESTVARETIKEIQFQIALLTPEEERIYTYKEIEKELKNTMEIEVYSYAIQAYAKTGVSIEDKDLSRQINVEKVLKEMIPTVEEKYILLVIRKKRN